MSFGMGFKEKHEDQGISYRLEHIRVVPGTARSAHSEGGVVVGHGRREHAARKRSPFDLQFLLNRG